MEFRSLDYFLAVVESGSFRAAALRLGVTQPAVTKAVRRLEDSFGVALFDRQARGVSLTPCGKAILRHARDLNASLGAAWEEVAALRSGVTGLVRLGAGPFWQDMVLSSAIAELRTSRPGVRVRVVGGSDDHLKTLLKGGSLDIALAAVPDAPRLEPELAWQPLLADEYRVIADVEHPLRAQESVTLDNLLDFPWILPAATTYMVERLGVLFRAQDLPPPVPVIETDVIALKFGLMRGAPYLSFHGAAHLAANNPGSLAPLDVAGGSARRDAGIITRRGIAPSPPDEALIKILERLCALPDLQKPTPPAPWL